MEKSVNIDNKNSDPKLSQEGQMFEGNENIICLQTDYFQTCQPQGCKVNKKFRQNLFLSLLSKMDSRYQTIKKIYKALECSK